MCIIARMIWFGIIIQRDGYGGGTKGGRAEEKQGKKEEGGEGKEGKGRKKRGQREEREGKGAKRKGGRDSNKPTYHRQQVILVEHEGVFHPQTARLIGEREVEAHVVLRGDLLVSLQLLHHIAHRCVGRELELLHQVNQVREDYLQHVVSFRSFGAQKAAPSVQLWPRLMECLMRNGRDQQRGICNVHVSKESD